MPHVPPAMSVHRRLTLSFATMARRLMLSFAAMAFLLLASPVSPLELNPSSEFRRRLVGPGSSPPSCRSRCGSCRPCEPVHVPVRPGVSMSLEYYPEAWRCKCGNKLFLP